MCGIVAFLTTSRWEDPASLGVYEAATESLRTALETSAGVDAGHLEAAVGSLAEGFDDLMAFALVRAIATDPAAHATLSALADSLEGALAAVRRQIAAGGSDDRLQKLSESLTDYLWQVRAEVLERLPKVRALLPDAVSSPPRLYVAWGAERVLDSLDKLEVRGRDSAGIALTLTLTDAAPLEAGPLAEALAARSVLPEARTGGVLRTVDEAGRPVLRVLHKVANLVGRLGDNGAALRAAIRDDALLWAAADHLAGLSVLAHTRWASNGIISLANCHPVDGRLAGPLDGQGANPAVLAVINGDIDNYGQLVAAGVTGRNHALDPAVTTDAKILPVKLALETDPARPAVERVMSVLRACHGSLATGVQLADAPEQLVVGQQGSGQALYFGATRDGWMVASEVYGLAATCRRHRALNTGGDMGVAVALEAADGDLAYHGWRLTGEPWETPEEPIALFSRDIFRGEADYFIEKEIAEAPDSVQKTITGKYVHDADGVRFLLSGFGNGEQLAARLHDAGRPPVRRIIVIGHGTASVAGMGIAHMLRRAVGPAGISVDWAKASELFGFSGMERLDDCILIAVSQSGTTTDTNRIVDIARKRGAWVHAIVNRRNSALVQKAASYLYTSDGRDVEMSVASTKAYYSQVAAGKVLSLFLAAQLQTMSRAELEADLTQLDALPDRIRQVLANRAELRRLAETYALKARNWALVGNGANRVAAEEIRIKLSELCYKAIPCDVTEDKKHIDLSTEPLTLVVANDLPEEVVQDTVKEVAIFKAHNGRPLVFASAGETRFDGVAEAVVSLPSIGGGLAFVLATVAGHLFGVAAARAIDGVAETARLARGLCAEARDYPGRHDRATLLNALEPVADTLAGGAMDTALPASAAAAFLRGLAGLERGSGAPDPAEIDGILGVLTALVEELTRSIDTIRHQAKTVTVGVSRPQQELSPLIEETMVRLGLAAGQLRDDDRDILEAISPLVDGVRGGIRYAVHPARDGGDPQVEAVRAVGLSDASESRYAEAAPAAGSKRTALRKGGLHFTTGAHDSQSVAVVPVAAEGAPSATDLLLLDLTLIPAAPATQLASILKALGAKHDELVDLAAERLPGLDVPTLLSGATPRDVLFRSADWLVDRAAVVAERKGVA